MIAERPGAAALRALPLLVICAYAILSEFSPRPGLTPIAGIVLASWLLIEVRHMATVAQITVGAAVLLVLLAWANGTFDAALAFKAIDRAAFFTWFILSMDVLRIAALRSRLMRRTGKTLVDQPPGRRYLMLTLGTHFTALLMNLGAVTLLGTVSQQAARRSRDRRVAEIRLRRMSLAVLRGFSAATLWLPTSITVQIVLTAIPDYDWYGFAAQGAATAATFLAMGWLLDRLGPQVPPADGRMPTLGSALFKLVPMALLGLGILLATGGLMAIAGLRLIAALLCVVACCGLGWIAVQPQTTSAVTAGRLWIRALHKRILPAMADMRSDIAVLSCAGFIAVLLPAQMDSAAVAAFLRQNDIGGTALMIAILWLLPVIAPLGLNPIVSVSVSIEILVSLPGIHLPAPALALTATAAWCMATGVSPLSATPRILGRSIGRAPARIGLVWNLPFTLCAGLAATAALLAIAR